MRRAVVKTPVDALVEKVLEKRAELHTAEDELRDAVEACQRSAEKALAIFEVRVAKVDAQTRKTRTPPKAKRKTKPANQVRRAKPSAAVAAPGEGESFQAQAYRMRREGLSSVQVAETLGKSVMAVCRGYWAERKKRGELNGKAHAAPKAESQTPPPVDRRAVIAEGAKRASHSKNVSPFRQAVKARAKEKEVSRLVTTEAKDGHAHIAELGDTGSGETTPGGRDGHTHFIFELEVRPADDGHTHTLTETRA